MCVWDRCNGRRYLLCIHGGVYSTRVYKYVAVSFFVFDKVVVD